MDPEVETAAPAAEAAPAATPSAAPAPDATPAAAVTPAFPGHDAFSWDSWDGKPDALPEPVRGWASKLEGHYTKEATAREAEAKELRELYERLTTDSEDPRVGETKAELDKAKAEHAEKVADYEKQLARYQAWEQELDKVRSAESARQVEEFKTANGWIWDNGPIEQLANELVDEEFTPTDLPVILRLPPDLIEAARKLCRELVASGTKDPGKLAIRITRSEAKFAPAPSESLQAAPATRIVTPTNDRPGAPNDFEERRARVVAAANAQMKAG